MGFFDDPQRNEIRRRENIGFLTDYFIRSEVSDYYRLRILINSMIGGLISWVLYEIAWKNLNFGDFDPTYGIIVKWVIIGLTTYAFATSAIFRCALFCVLVGAFGKQGQYPFTMLIVSNLHEGPISNMMNNYEVTSEIVMCHIELQSKIVSNRVALLSGPLEELVEKLLAKGTRAMKRVSQETRALLAPFVDHLGEQRTKTDEKEEIEEKQLEDIERRRQKILKLWEKSMNRKLTQDDEIVRRMIPSEEMVNNATIDEPPIWKRFKTSIIQKFTAKLSKKCLEMFNKGIDKCRNMAAEMLTSCEKSIVWPLATIICPRLGVEGVCESVERRVKSNSICRSQFDSSNMDPSLENDIVEVMDLTKQLDENSNIEMHSVRVESPRTEIEYRLSDLKIKIRATGLWLKNIAGVSKHIFQAFFIYFVYTIFRDAVLMIRKYHTDVAFQNSFVTGDFWMVDEHRREKGLTHLTAFTKGERREWKLMEIRSWPTAEERHKAIRPFLKWFILLIIVIIFVILDYYFYSFIDSVVDSARQQVKQTAKSSAGLNVTGEGVIAEFLKTMTTSNQTLEIDQTLSNEHCLMKPTSPNKHVLIFWLALPLIFSFLFQVLFSFAIKRLVLNYFMPYMFPRRSRVRLIYFYNKCLISRETHRKEARARIRFMTDRKRIQLNRNHGHFSAGAFFKMQIFDRLFATAKCLVCQEKAKPRKMMYCSNMECQSIYCKACIEDNFNNCYACMVTRKEIDDEKSKLMKPTGKVDEFINYREYHNRMRLANCFR